MNAAIMWVSVCVFVLAGCPEAESACEGEGEDDSAAADVCASSRDCPNSRCVDGQCLPVGCIDSTDCGAGLVCSTLQCPAVCTAPAAVGDVCLAWSDVSTCPGLPPTSTRACADGLVCEAPPAEPSFGSETHCVVAPQPARRR